MDNLLDCLVNYELCHRGLDRLLNILLFWNKKVKHFIVQLIYFIPSTARICPTQPQRPSPILSYTPLLKSIGRCFPSGYDIPNLKNYGKMHT
jgi:hypothetical protein